jgi:TolB-like protein/Tfp pilus assembly protein PilF
VREVPGIPAGDEIDAPTTVPQSKDAAGRAPQFSRRWLLAVVALVAVALIVVERYVLTDHPTENPSADENAETLRVESATPANSIAVLPFVNLSSDPEQEYFADGLSEELLSNLARRGDLQVTARSSSFAFKQTDKSVQEIAHALGAAHVLEGSVRRVGNQLRITAQLINAADGYNLWSATYNRELGDVFAIQEEIAAIVAESLRAPLGVGPSSSGLGGTENAEAYALYIAARAHHSRVTLENNVRCIEYLDQAISLDPGFAAAWARKSFAHAYAHGLLLEKGGSEHTAAAVRAAQHAIELEPNLGLAHAALGQAWSFGPNLAQAEDQYRKAIALGQRLAEVPEYATLQLAVGNMEKARALFRDAREADPLNPTILAFLLGSHHMVGDTAAALAEYERHRTLHGHHKFADFLTDVGLLGTGDISSPSALPLQADEIDQAAAEHFDTPERALQQLHVLYADARYADWFSRRRLAMWAAYFGDSELALNAMNDAATATPLHLFLLWFPLFSEVRQQAGFRDLMREHGIVAHWRTYGWPKYCRPLGGDDFECS